MHPSHYPILLIVTSHYTTHWYVVNERQITLLHTVRDEKDHYSDREGFFQVGGHGRTIRTGAPIKENVNRTHETKQHLLHVGLQTRMFLDRHHIQHLVISAPEHIRTLVGIAMKKSRVGMSYTLVPGNYIHAAPERLMILAKQGIQPVYYR